MTIIERYFAVATQHVGRAPDEDNAAFYGMIDQAVCDYDARLAAGESVRLFVIRPLDDADLYDWGVSSDAIPEVSEYTGPGAARSIARGLPGGRVWRRRIGSPNWQEVPVK